MGRRVHNPVMPRGQDRRADDTPRCQGLHRLGPSVNDQTYGEALIKRVRPAFVRVDAEWLLEEEVIEAIVETAGDLVQLARELDLQADLCVLVWMPENAGMGEAAYASFRRYAFALKVTAAALDLPRP